ncbi:nuclear transport factor 2 family protein [Algibacter luteus]|uniref:Putative lumazine-binding n=1 Tax=Algibacter luteus TaxID=1178825 RepID=A0A1M6EKP6_9FLAO|nr:nuclear transport factor 2 family protein [Algibacter luteus]SHI86082.1 Putative lumazine-binding [Algibacter luteus]
MKCLTVLVTFLLMFSTAISQNNTDKEGVENACLNYIEGFYQGDENKLKESLQPALNKFGFWKDKTSNQYKQVDHMSFEKALEFARNVLEKKKFPNPDAPKKIEVLDIGNVIASAKVTAWWGIDYILLSKRDDIWMIEQVLWEGPLQKSED